MTVSLHFATSPEFLKWITGLVWPQLRLLPRAPLVFAARRRLLIGDSPHHSTIGNAPNLTY